MAIYEINKQENLIPANNRPSSIAEFPASFGVSPIDRTLDHISDNLDRQEKAANKQLAKIQAYQDKTTQVEYDNPVQKEMIERARKESGIDEAFNTISLEQLKNPYGAAQIESKYGAFKNHPLLREVTFQRAMAKKFMDDVTKISDQGLRDMAMEDLDAYRQGRIDGSKLTSGSYKPIDVADVLGKRFKSIAPMVETELKKQGITNYAEVSKVRDKAAMQNALEYSVADPAFKNNMISRGYMDKSGQFTPEGKDYIDNIMSAYQVDEDRMQAVKRDNQGLNITVDKNSTFSGTYEGNSTKNINISGGGSGDLLQGKTEDERKHNILVKKYADMGLGVKGVTDVVLEAAKSGDQKDLYRAALLNENTSLVNFTAKEYGLSPREAANKIIKDNGLKYKAKDKTIRPDIATDLSDAAQAISDKAIRDAKAWLKANPGNPIKAKKKAYKVTKEQQEKAKEDSQFGDLNN